MAQRSIVIPGIGPVLLSKRRGTKNMRLSVNSQGKVRVGLPMWVPYGAGVIFAQNRTSWVKQQQAKNSQPPLRNGDYIGKLHRLHFLPSPGKSKVSCRITATTINITSSLPFNSPDVQEKIRAASERALKRQANLLLAQRLNELARSHGFIYKDVRIRRLTSRWGSCSNDKTITLSYFLVQLPWPLIDYVIIHELIHTKHLHHGQQFWADFTRALPEAKSLQKQIRRFRPRIEPTKVIEYVT